MGPAQDPAGGRSDAQTRQGGWVAISEGVLGKLAEEGKKPGWPGQTAGVSVDRTTGAVRMIVPDQGLWKSSDRGATFTRVDGGSLGGRCETGFALNADPAGRRLACFMLDGPSAITLNGGKTWNALQQMGRGWDFGAVDWSRPSPQDILAVHHESGGELHLSTDGGKSWKLLGKDFTAVGIFDAGAFVASKGEGILRSVDGGSTWTKVCDRTPTGRVLCVFKGVGYWVTREGLLVSKDRGATWQAQGSAIEAAWGPFFGKNAKQMVVVGKMGRDMGFWQTEDAGQSWRLAAPFPDFAHESPPDWTPSKQWGAGWFITFGWDPIGQIFYASRMGHPTFQYARTTLFASSSLPALSSIGRKAEGVRLP
jgi:photosystem II stability/assembly factor-like uncharacterized protein